MRRRDFLKPRRLAQTAGELLGVLGPARAPVAAPPEFGLVTCTRRAMATHFEVMIPLGIADAVEAAQNALDLIDQLESQLTVYRDNSEMSGINRLAPTAPVRVEERLFDLLTLAARLTAETEGAFDVSVGALIKAWGFFRRRGRVPSPEERAEVHNRMGMDKVVFDPENRSVRFQVPGLEINLGSIGKGCALDRVAEVLRHGWQIPSALLHGGHSSVYALGAPPGDPHGWAVRLRHPWNPRRALGVLRLRDRGLATSGATFQHLEYEGRKLGHILDPRTCWPAEGMASATAVAPTAAEADALATAFYILGVDKARAYCTAHPGIGAILLPEGDGARPVVLGLGPHEFSLGNR